MSPPIQAQEYFPGTSSLREERNTFCILSTLSLNGSLTLELGPQQANCQQETMVGGVIWGPPCAPFKKHRRVSSIFLFRALIAVD
jgi:hypothetical protein